MCLKYTLIVRVTKLYCTSTTNSYSRSTTVQSTLQKCKNTNCIFESRPCKSSKSSFSITESSVSARDIGAFHMRWNQTASIIVGYQLQQQINQLLHPRWPCTAEEVLNPHYLYKKALFPQKPRRNFNKMPSIFIGFWIVCQLIFYRMNHRCLS